MFSWIKKHKKAVILLLIAALIAAGVLSCRKKAQDTMAALSEMSEETAFVERRSIQSSVSSTGQIISDNTRTISAAVSGLEVLTVNVEIGDTVQAGDIICTFDVSDLEDSLEDAEKTLSAAKTQSSLSVAGAKRALEQAIETKNYQIESAARNVLSASEAYDSAAEAYDKANSKLTDAYNAMKQIEKRRNAATAQSIEALQQSKAESQAKLTAAQALKSDAQSAFDAASAAEAQAQTDYAAGMISQQQLEEAIAKKTVADAANQTAAGDLASAQAAYNSAESALNSYDPSAAAAAEAEYASAKASYETLDSSMTSLESALRSARNAYESARAAYDYTVTAQDTQYQSSKDSLTGAKASAGVATIQQENAVDTYEKQIEKGELKADISGTVTAVTVKEGDIYAGGPAVTIQDCEQLVVSAEIDEYDIADIAIGMKALFKTDATREQQLEGEVIFISPTPTPGSDVTYQVKVRINTPTDRLRIGMNAKLNIILAETENVLTVPYDAVQQDENGNDIVYVVARSENAVTKTAVPVTVGAEGDYYVEISGDIAEGTEVSLPSDQTFDFAALMSMGRE